MSSESALQASLRVKLHPFLHQVSGHKLMFLFDSNTICKALEPNEQSFYECMPDSLKPFTAHYKGALDVECEETDDGFYEFYGVVPLDNAHKLISKDSVRCQLDVLLDSYDVSSNCHLTLDFFEKTEIRITKNGRVEILDEDVREYAEPMLQTGAPLNKHLMDLIKGGTHKYILLENLTANMSSPCVLDLKLGSRTFGDDESSKKQLSKSLKAERSTTKDLSVRLHGMHKYSMTAGVYETIDKYTGRTFDKLQFVQSLCDYLCDGSHIRHELILPIVERLQQFYDCISKLDSHRFYSSSLLIIYDGGETFGNIDVDIRAVDFAHTSFPQNHHFCKRTLGPDIGYLSGIETLIDVFSTYAKSFFNEL